MRAPGGLARAAAVLAALALPACSGPFAPPGGAPSESVYDRLAAPLEPRFAAARKLFDAGELAPARVELAALARAAPDHVPSAILAQEVELASGGVAARAELARRALAELEARPTAARCVLAARVAEDPAAARELLGRALALDPDCAWARYGLAHLAARGGDWADAADELELALELDPFLPPARRLQAMLLARDGRRREAIEAFESWRDDAALDPRVGLRELVESELDLATLYVLEGDHDAAHALLTRLALDGEDAVRALCVLAAAEQGAGRAEEALHATRAAQELAPDVALPWVQEAILRRSWLDDPEGAEAAWRRLLASSEGGGDLSRVLLSMRARLALERAERRRERAQGEGR